MAWHYAQYAGRVAAAGKAEYPLPMFVNSALHRSSSIADALGKPRETGTSQGRFAMGGPMDDLLDVWRAGGPAIDMLSPDAYGAKDFPAWCEKYSRGGNPLFIAETSGGAGGAPTRSTPSGTMRSARPSMGSSSISCGTIPTTNSAASTRPFRNSCP